MLGAKAPGGFPHFRSRRTLASRAWRERGYAYELASRPPKGYEIQSLRHTFGAHKADKQMSLATLQELMGHKKKETTLKYIHLAKTNLRAEMARRRYRKIGERLGNDYLLLSFSKVANKDISFIWLYNALNT
jgi:integrase